jgi:hypothetical protein
LVADAEIPNRYIFQGADLNTFNLRYPMNNEDAVRLVRGLNIPRGYGVVDPNNRDPYSLQWSFDIQRQLANDWAFQTGYVGNKGLKITASHNFNLPDRVTGVRPFPNALQFGWRNQSDFSYYHAWQSSLRKRMSKGLAFNLHYTWSKSMSIHAGDFWPGNDIRVQDENNWDADLGPTRFDATHRLVGDFIYQLPLRAKGPLARLANDWQITGTFNATSGQALNIEQRSNLDFSRPDYAGGNVYADGRDRFQWVNPAAFALVPIGPRSGLPLRAGNVGRASMRDPGTWGLNAGLAKAITFREKYRFQFRAEAFNFTNTPILGGAQTDFTRPTFGRILGVGGTRTVQLQGRFSF